MNINLMQGDCLELMKLIPDASVDMILCDLPYGTTACAWDSVIPFEPLWAEYRRIAKANAAIVLTASQPFTTQLIASNLAQFKYSWVWDKVKPSGHLVSKIRPMQRTEDIVVFGRGRINYYPIMIERERPIKSKEYGRTQIMGGAKGELTGKFLDKKHPQNVLVFSNASQVGKTHPTQKPVALMEYLIMTYTNEGDTVLDNCMGSGTTGVACKNLNRNFIGIEMDEKYFEIAKNRIECANP